MGLRFTSDDSPQGDYMPLMKAGIIEKKTAAQSFKGGFWNPNNWLLGVQYATCFGVELHVNNWAATYFKEVFEVSPTAAANMASVFGWMNLFCLGRRLLLGPRQQALRHAGAHVGADARPHR